MKRLPIFDHRYREAVRLLQVRQVSDDPKINMAIDYLSKVEKKEFIEETPFIRAWELYTYGTQSRIIIEASLLAKDVTMEEMANFLELKLETVDLYKHLFFDSTLIKDRLEMTDYLVHLKREGRDAEWKTKGDAYRFGFYTICDCLAVGTQARSSDQIMNNQLQLFDSMLRQAMGTSINSPAANQAKDWLKAMGPYLKMKQHKELSGDVVNNALEFRRMLLIPAKEVLDLNDIKDELIV